MCLKSIKQIAVVFFLVITTQTSLSQISDTIPWLGKKYIEAGISYYNESKYDEALKQFEKVSPCDPEYPTACYEAALTYEGQNEFGKGLQKILEADSIQPNSANTITLKASLLDDLGHQKEAIELLENARTKWPYNHNLLYNLAIVYVNIKEYNKAEDLLTECIRLSPYHSGTHMLLGRINYFMGRPAQSVLAFNMGLLLNPSVNNVNKFENAVTQNTKPTPTAYLYPYKNDSDSEKWKKLNQFCNSGLAFNNAFPYNLTTNYLINRQSLLLFRMMSFDPADKSIYNQFYIRFYKEVMDRNETELFFAYQFQNVNNEKINTWLKSNKTKYDKFVEFAQKTINEWREYSFSTENETKKIKTHTFNDNGKISVIGTKLVSGNPVFDGNYIRVGNNGEVIEKGLYKDDKLEGACTLYWPSGRVKQALNFYSDELDAINKTFFENGNISGTYPRNKGKKDGIEKKYTLSGRVVSDETFVNDKPDGKTFHLYTLSGWSSESNYKNGKLNGSYTEKWLNGKLKSTGMYTDSLLNGTWVKWYSNGKKESEINYKNDYLVGLYKEFHTNAGIKYEYTYNDSSQITGTYNSYDRNGLLKTSQKGYEKGILNGLHTDFYSNGAKKDEYLYKDNQIQKITCFEPEGKIRYETEEKDGILAFKYYYDSGQVKRSGNFVNGKRQGTWNEFSAGGIITSIENWKDDMQSGEQKTFYQSGTLKSEFSCDSNKIHGSYRTYYPDKSLQSITYYIKGEANGESVNFFSNGKVSSKRYFIDNKVTGRSFEYSVNGKLLSVIEYDEDGDIKKELVYTSDQKTVEISHIEDSLHVEIKYPNGQARVRYNMIDGLKHGLSESFYPNGKIQSSQIYVYGNLQGDSKNWDVSGNLYSLFPYNMNKIEGYTCFYNNNKVISRGYYEENVEQGKYSEFYPNGKVFREISFTDGEREGLYTFYSPDSVVMVSFVYDEGSMSSVNIRNRQGKFENIKATNTSDKSVISYYPNGTIAAEVPFTKGIFNGKMVLYYPNGSKLRERDYVDDYVSGISTDYYPNGKIKEQYENVNNDMHGHYVSYSENGIKLIEGQYNADNKTGTWTYYDAAGKLKQTVVYENDNANEIR